ncbi:COX15/CtaA family protein [Miltoncostaea oceani]|uniref:COX15/CtaA family protein n=1 Tax=Miltoncostaea oceani TaxID=2843216 RepID=UPI001C3D379A|nr:COX15/CtaA family protein [Miltoncostaea oceani]
MRDLLRRLRTPSAFARLALVTMALLWVVVPSGAIVRLTASGLGCPDWPLCDGGVVPAAAGHAAIEYTNRLLSGVVGLVAIGTWLVARRLPGAPAALHRWALGAAAACVVQMPLGAVTVLSGLHPLAVGSHFLVSIAALGCGTLLALGARDHRDGVTREWSPRRGVLAVLTTLSAAVVVVTGVIVTAAGPHSGDDDVTKRFGDLLLALQVHVRAAIVFTVLAAVLIAWVAREGGVDRLTARLAALALPLVALQIAVGEYQYRNGLPWQVVVVHVSIAALVWAVIVAACRGVARPVRATGDYALRDATRWQGTQRTESGSALSRPSGISAPQSTQIP